MFTKAWRWLSFSLQVFPGALPSIKPSGPRALNRSMRAAKLSITHIFRRGEDGLRGRD
jgi:hypothetical protein